MSKGTDAAEGKGWKQKPMLWVGEKRMDQFSWKSLGEGMVNGRLET